VISVSEMSGPCQGSNPAGAAAVTAEGIGDKKDLNVA
jgi:hypothetical protein